MAVLKTVLRTATSNQKVKAYTRAVNADEIIHFHFLPKKNILLCSNSIFKTSAFLTRLYVSVQVVNKV